MFDLDKSIAAWRRTLEYNRIFTADDIDELEQHVRDQVAVLVAAGSTEQLAFRKALQEMGGQGTAEAEYRKVYWGKRRRRGEVMHELQLKLSMLGNYLKIAVRALFRHKGYAAINIFGLSAAMAACLILGLYVTQALSYDLFHADSDRIVRVVQHRSDSEGHATMPPGFAGAIEEHFPEVETVTEILGFAGNERVLTYGDRQIRVEGLMSVDDRFFDVFSFPLLVGDARAALAAPNQLILTKSTARRIFGDGDPIGKTICLGATSEYTVAAIAADPPPNTHIPFNALRSSSERDRNMRAGQVIWNRFHGRIYVKLKPGIDKAEFREKLDAYQMEHRSSENGTPADLLLQPLTDIHLHSSLNGEYAPTSDIRYVQVFGAAGLLLLLIACVNYVNLTTAQAMQRIKEVGVRKVLGALRTQLTGQFLSESMLVVLLALPLALALAALMLPTVNELTGQALSLQTANRPAVWAGILGLFGIVGIGAGAYPALTLSAFRPSRALIGGSMDGRARYRLRRGLIVFQFAASFALLIGALTVYSQLNFLQTKRLGFEATDVVTFHTPGRDWKEFDVFRTSLAEEPSILGMASGPPLGINWRNFTMNQPDGDGTGEQWALDALSVGYDYIETAQMQLVAGRSFSPEFPTDAENAVIITASAAERLGFDGEGLGETVSLFDDMTVIGVVEDFHNVSLREPLKPTALLLDPQHTGSIVVRIAPGQTESALAALQRTWTTLVPEQPFIFEFLDEQIQAQYLAEERLSRVFGLFAGLAVALAALGLLGLAAFAAQQRTKEIGIRKVLGATIFGIVRLLTGEFLTLVAIAAVVAIPLSYIGMERWLQDFAYRIDIGPGVFAVAITITVATALLSVSVQAIRAGRTNPARSLRSE